VGETKRKRNKRRGMTKRKILERGTKGRNIRRKRYNWRREIKIIKKRKRKKITDIKRNERKIKRRE